MRGRIALQKRFMQNVARCLFLFREARHGTSPSDGGLSEWVRFLAPLWSFHMCVYAQIQRR
jgi:hypothetical protein